MPAKPGRRPRMAGERWDFALGEWVKGDPSEPPSMTPVPFAPVSVLPTPPSNQPNASMDPDREQGPVESQARLDIGELGSLKGLEGTMAESVYALARGIDGMGAENGASLAAMSNAAKELRNTLDRIAELVSVRSKNRDPRLDNMGTPE